MQARITGITEVDRALAQLERGGARKLIRSSMRQALKMMWARARELAPVGKSTTLRGKPHEGGTLRKKIKVRAIKVKRRGEIALAVRVSKKDYQGDEFYAAFPEEGTEKQRAQHFLLRAFDQLKDRVRDKTIELIRAGLNASLNWWHTI